MQIYLEKRGKKQYEEKGRYYRIQVFNRANFFIQKNPIIRNPLNAFERIQMHPNVLACAQRIQMSPNKSEHVQKLQKYLREPQTNCKNMTDLHGAAEYAIRG